MLGILNRILFSLLLFGCFALEAEASPLSVPDSEKPDHMMQRARELATLTPEGLAAEIEASTTREGIFMEPIDGLADLLLDHAWLDLALDRCNYSSETTTGCDQVEENLRMAEQHLHEVLRDAPAEFVALLDLPNTDATQALPTTKAGEQRAPLGSIGVDPGGGFSQCLCDIWISSKDRYMSGYWALECGNELCLPVNHGGHGFCDTNVDICHSPGDGAMTGSIEIKFADNPWVKIPCPDDHRTCFKGPIESPGPPPTPILKRGKWGSTCSCDTTHSTGTNPTQPWFQGGSTRAWSRDFVGQANLQLARADGPCGGKKIKVKQIIKENDPVCCDDYMGELEAELVLGWIGPLHSISKKVSATNCQGGSQSGVTPNCGEFGATIGIEAYCMSY